MDTDACTTTCQDAVCGDSFIYAGMEECDDGGTEDGGLCSSTCQAEACTLFGIDENRTIFRVNKATGALTSAATADAVVGVAAGLAYAPSSGTVYLSSTSNDGLYTVDLSTGAATLVGGYGTPNLAMHGLEWDSSTNTLYGFGARVLGEGGYYSINVATGVATRLTPQNVTPLDWYSNLAYDSKNDVMYMTNTGTASGYTIDRATGVETLVGPMVNVTGVSALAYDFANDTIYVLDNFDDQFGTFDRATGEVTVLGATSGNLLGLVCAPE